MKSVKHLVPELLDAYPLLLYQGVRGGDACCRGLLPVLLSAASAQPPVSHRKQWQF
jgi:hypothetical protein